MFCNKIAMAVLRPCGEKRWITLCIMWITPDYVNKQGKIEERAQGSFV